MGHADQIHKLAMGIRTSIEFYLLRRDQTELKSFNPIEAWEICAPWLGKRVDDPRAMRTFLMVGDIIAYRNKGTMIGAVPEVLLALIVDKTSKSLSAVEN